MVFDEPGMILRERRPDLGRRLWLAGALAALACPAPSLAAAPKPGLLRFEIRRAGAVIGRHEVQISSPAADTLVAAIEAELVVHVGPVPVYRYAHTATETWRGDRFDTLDATTRENGGRRSVVAHAAGQGVTVAVNGRETTLAGRRSPLTHWNAAALAGPLFNAQTGAAMNETATRREGARATLGDGRTVAATEIQLKGAAAMTDWFDGDGLWAGLSLKAPDGSTIEYRRV